jgi:asparagine synthase (glutamine-hydrolysing)
VKPLFYTVIDHTIVFGSEIKALFEYPGIKPRVTKEGLCEIFGLGPAKTYGKGVFKISMRYSPVIS